MAKTNAQRQSDYRARHLKDLDGQAERLNLLVNLHAKRALACFVRRTTPLWTARRGCTMARMTTTKSAFDWPRNPLRSNAQRLPLRTKNLTSARGSE